jgi:hypothetical protein
MTWGLNDVGQLGTESTASSNVPLKVNGPTGVTAVAGSDDHSLALLSDGTVVAWGANEFGQLGTGSSTGPEKCVHETSCSTKPLKVTGLKEVTAIAAGSGYSLALLSNRTVMAWGTNAVGELGDESNTGSDVPVGVKGLKEVVAIAAGASHSLALLSDGTVMAWGHNSSGELGNESNSNSNVPVKVKALNGVTVIAGGFEDSLAVAAAGTATTLTTSLYGEGKSGEKIEVTENAPVSDHAALAGENAAQAGGTVTYRVYSDSECKTLASLGLAPVTVTNGSVPESPGKIGFAQGTYYWQAEYSGDGGNEASISRCGAEQLIVGPAVPPGPAPTVTGIAPKSGSSSGGTLVTIAGTGFTGVTHVMFGAGQAIIKSSSSTSITVESPAGSGTVIVTVTTPNGTSPASGKPAKRAKFKYKRPKK